MNKAKLSRIVIVDADVMRSAGVTEKGESSACRDVLDNILNICHKVMVTEEINQEWKKHRSKFAYYWITSMIARKKIIRKKITGKEDVKKEVEKEINSLSIPELQKEKMCKDIHLVIAALCADGIIITKEKRLNVLFSMTKNIPKIRELKWLDPCNDECRKEKLMVL